MTSLDLQGSALVIIDLQKGIVARDSLPYGSAQVVNKAALLVKAFRNAQLPVMFVHVAFSADFADALSPVADTPMQFPPPPPDWAEIVPELGKMENDVLITKRQWGAFYGTDLDLQLRRRGITQLVLCGISTDLGVESTARDATERAYRLVFVEDAMSAMRSAEDHEHSTRRIFPLIGLVETTKQVLEALS